VLRDDDVKWLGVLLNVPLDRRARNAESRKPTPSGSGLGELNTFDPVYPAVAGDPKKFPVHTSDVEQRRDSDAADEIEHASRSPALL
jgi:hypothetical protein